MSEENKPREFIIQRGSFCYVIVERLDSNPDWANKPFKVIEFSAYQALEARHKKLLEVLKLIEKTPPYTEVEKIIQYYAFKTIKADEKAGRGEW